MMRMGPPQQHGPAATGAWFTQSERGDLWLRFLRARLFRGLDAVTCPPITEPKFSSWSLIRADSGRYFHAMSARLRPIVQLKRITKWVSQIQTFPRLPSLIHQQLTRILIRANC